MRRTQWMVAVLVMLLATGVVGTQFLHAQAEPGSGPAAAEQPADAAAQDADAEEQAAGPEVIAIKFHADWCGYCKAMGDIFDELQAKFDQEPVLYLTFDQTREHHTRQSQYLAHALGLEDVWAEYGGRTGFILLIDGQTGEVIDQLDHEQDLSQMGESLVDAVNR